MNVGVRPLGRTAPGGSWGTRRNSLVAVILLSIAPAVSTVAVDLLVTQGRDVGMSGKRRKFTPEFRAHSVRLVTETGRPVAHVAAEIGIGAQLLGRWVAKEKSDAGCDNRLVLDDDERAELNRLREENAELRLDRAFLKKAATFFASESNR